MFMFTTGFILHNKRKNPIMKPQRKISKESTVNQSSGFWCHKCTPL